MIVPPGGQVVCALQWKDQFGGSANDYDLLAVDTLGDLLAASFNQPPPFRNERRRHLHAAGRDTGGVAGDLFLAPRLPILDTAWP
jgi:hypothetical protein